MKKLKLNLRQFLPILRKILVSKKAKTLYWQILNGFIIFVIGGLADLDWKFFPVLIAALNGVTKYINLKYIPYEIK